MTSTARAAERAHPDRGGRLERGRNGQPARARREVSLDDKYVLDEGRVLLTGVQALVRLVLDQHRADRAPRPQHRHDDLGLPGLAARRPRQGAPAQPQAARRAPRAPRARPQRGARRDLGLGQPARRRSCPARSYDGVLGMWYGKAPGLDRAADSLRHGNFVGVSRTGGGLAVVGDDPSCKSSTIPSASESMLASLHMPVFFPGNVQEVLDLGLHAFACSRASGLWAGFKIVTSVADAVGTAEVAPGPRRPGAARPRLRARAQRPPAGAAPRSRWSAPCSACARTSRSPTRARTASTASRAPRDAWLGIVAAGKPYYDLRRRCATSASATARSSAPASASSSSA